jgi:hypothetical protein
VCRYVSDGVHAAWNTFWKVTGFVSVKRPARHTSATPRCVGSAAPWGQLQRQLSRAHARKGTFPLAPMYHGLSAGEQRREVLCRGCCQRRQEGVLGSGRFRQVQG